VVCGCIVLMPASSTSSCCFVSAPILRTLCRKRLLRSQINPRLKACHHRSIYNPYDMATTASPKSLHIHLKTTAALRRHKDDLVLDQTIVVLLLLLLDHTASIHKTVASAAAHTPMRGRPPIIGHILSVWPYSIVASLLLCPSTSYIVRMLI
jgi:hypothetical protein